MWKHASGLMALLVGTLTLPVLAQNKTDQADVNWGPELNDKTDGDFVEIVGEHKDAVYMTMSFKKKLHLQKMDLNMKVLWHKPLELEVDKKDYTLERIYVTDEQVIVFSSFFDKKEDQNSLYAKVYDADDFSPKSRMQKVARISAEKARNSGDFSVRISPDGSKLMVNIIPPREKGEVKPREIKVFDMGLQELWSKKVKTPDEQVITDLRMDNDGSVIAVTMFYPEKQERRERKREGKPMYDHHLLVYTKDSEQPSDHPIKAGDKFLQDMQITLGKEGDIICGGLYGTRNSWNVRGTFFLKLDRRTKAIKHESYKEFTDDFITAYMTEKEEKKAKKKADKKDEELELFEFDLDDIIRRDDGGAVMVMEQYHMYAVTNCYTTPNGGRSCTTTYHYIYNDVIVVNIDPEGNIEWAVKVPKRQHTTNDGGYYSSYAMEVKGDKIHLIFNDTGENLYVKPGDKIKQFELSGKDALVTIATIDGLGNVKREALFTPERRDVILKPKDCVQLDNDQMLVYAARKKEYRFGLIDFK
jgi:hypothetical protein